MASHPRASTSWTGEKKGNCSREWFPSSYNYKSNKNNMKKIKILVLCMPFCIGMSYILNRDSLYSQSGTAQADDNG